MSRAGIKKYSSGDIAMNLNKYVTFRDESSDQFYWFYSEGPRGRIRKVVQFQESDYSNVYNLSLGDDEGTAINFYNITNNKDTKKVLASITDIVEDYTRRFPDRWILVTGDDDAKGDYTKYISPTILMRYEMQDMLRLV